MPQQSLIWTVLPNGITTDDTSLRFSVLVSPRLDPENQPTMLRTFGDFVAWPKTLQSTKFTLLVGTKSIQLGPSNVDATIGTPDLAAWSALFPDTTFVRKFAMNDRSGNTVVSYDTVEMYSTIAKLYGELAANATDDLPTVYGLVQNKSTFANLVDIIQDLDDRFINKKLRTRNIAGMFDAYRAGKLSGVNAKFAEFQLFHTPPNEVTTQTVVPEDTRLPVTWQTHKRTTLDADKAVAEIDFHQIVAAMNPYPTLLRKLGIVLDFVVPRADVPRGADLALSVTAKLPVAPVPGNAAQFVKSDSAAPITHAVHTASTFTAAPRPAPLPDDVAIHKGLLKLDTKQFALLQADVDGGVHKLMNFTRTLAKQGRDGRLLDPTTHLPRHAAAPALRNAGLMLVHVKRGQSLTNAFNRNKTLNRSMKDLFERKPNATAGLYAEDLVRGWRFDVLDKTIKKWRSLCERTANYDINKGAVSLNGLHEEGTIRLAATSSADGSNADLVFLHEAVTVWNGWSLVAQQPGKAVDLDEQKQRNSQADIPDGVRLKTSFAPTPGSLPKLRYGREYAIRARAVDLAGNSLPPTILDYAGDNSAAAAQPYLRFEPVQPPGFALVGTSDKAQLPQSGESMAHVAVRSMNAQFDDPTPSDQKTDRWAVAPRISQREAELHGMLDGHQWGTPQQFALLVERDKELAHFGQKSTDAIATSGPVVGIPSKKKPANPKTPPITRGLEPDVPKYSVLPGGASALPYLPDPFCTRVIARFRNHPSISAHSLIEIPLYDDGKKWPDVSPRLIHVYEDNNDVPRYDAATRTLLVPTPKATRATLHLSSMLEPGNLDMMGVWNWVGKDAKTGILRKRAEAGLLWPLSPKRQLDIVHAVQRPLLKPDITTMNLYRDLGGTWVRPTVIAQCHLNSTDKVDFHGTWNDPRDVPGSSTPTNQAKVATPFAIKIIDPQGYAGIVEHKIPDGQSNTIMFGEFKASVNENSDIAAPKIHDFGDTRYRRVEYQLIGTTRFREYMPSDVLHKGAGANRVATDENITLEGTPVVQWALNSAAPPAPEVLYVVPMFGWARGVDSDGRITSWRKGSGLRVWLDRPWNTTGYGEMLAVVLPPEGVDVEPNDQPYKHIVTQWGNDPIWKSPFVKGVAPIRKNFPLKRVRRDGNGAWLPPGAPISVADQPSGDFQTQNLRYPGLSRYEYNGQVDIAPHDVYWDADRRLWYCDIQISHGEAYFPFVRLGLARYQPNSLPDVHLSNIVQSDFASLAPDRSMSITTGNPTRRRVRVFGFAPEQSSAYSEAARFGAEIIVNGKIVPKLAIETPKTTVIEVWLEKLTPSQGEDFGWHKVATGTESTYTQQLPPLTKNETPEMAFEWPTLWDGQIELPTAPSSSNRYRVVVAEYEEYLADGPTPYDNPFEKTARRLVFVEHVELT
ncbi:MAG: hypothetical protein ABI852_03925 [Gemmatimonadaceae bacterium]